MKMKNVENDNDNGGGTKILSGSNSAQLNSSIIKILSSNSASSSPIPMMKSSSMTSVTSATTTSSLISSTVATSQIINNSESEINTKRDSNNVNNTNIMKYDDNFNITSNINKATQFSISPKHTSRSNSSTSLNEYYSSSPIPTPKSRAVTKANTIPLPSYSYNPNFNSSDSSNIYEEYINDYGFYYTEEELNTYKSVTNFICKIAQLILRSRVGLSYNHNYYTSLNEKNHTKDSINNQLNLLSNCISNLNIKSSYASSVSSIDSQAHSIPYSMSINSSYNSSFESSYRFNPNGVYTPPNTCTGNNDVYIPTPSIDNIKQLHSLLLDRVQFWKNCIPINIDIFANSNGNSSYTYGKMGNDGCRRRSKDFNNANEGDEGIYDHRNDSSYNPSTSTRTRSSSISNIYPVKAPMSSNPFATKFNNKRLLERWVVSYEPNNNQQLNNKGRNSKVDTTDLILLVQSLYSYIRLMPLHSLLTDKSIKKNDLQYCISTADGFLLLPLFEGENSDIEFCDVGSSGFDLSAKLKVYKFTKASTTLGNLHISVVYDANINNSNPSTNMSHTISKPVSMNSSFNYNENSHYPNTTGVTSKTNTSKLNNNSPSVISLIQSKDNLLTDQCTEESNSSTSKTEEDSIKDKSNKKSDIPTDENESSTSKTNRKTVKTIGSPFPSPKTHTKVLSLTQNKYSFQPQSSHLSSSTPNLIHQLMNKQRLENKYGNSIHSLSDNNSLSSHSNLLLSGFNYKKSSINDGNKRNSSTIHQLNPINIPKNSSQSLNIEGSSHSKYLSGPQSLSLNSNKGNMDSQNNYSMELFGSLVGSYEESILSGRMSTLPSKPIKFISEIGVIGFGKCHPRLKCPQHINITFPVYFYEIPDKNDFFTTPYVGTVDIEQYLQKQNLLKRQKQEQEKKEQQQKEQGELETIVSLDTETNNNSSLEVNNKIESEELTNEAQTSTTSVPSAILLNNKPMIQRNSSTTSLNGSSSKFPGYRIPFKGQIQVIIKNPSKTAVKVFLVPYDFHDMPPGTKTFIRQKSYLKNAPNSKNSLDQKCSLRYAIHLQFISPSKKKLYLCKSLRVVFAHKAPEKDEKLYTISDGPIAPKYIPLVDNNSRNYSHNSNELNDNKIFGTDLSLKSDGKGLSAKDENGFYSSSYSSRRRSSFGSNIMMLAEMGVNLGDYSVSPVKPMVYQHSHSLQQSQHRGIGGINTKITKPLYYGGNSQVHFDDLSISKEDSYYSSDIPSSSQSTSSKYLHPNTYRYLTRNLNDKENIGDNDNDNDNDMSSKLPPKANERTKCTNFNPSSTRYSLGGLTKSIVDVHNNFYSKSSSQHISETSDFTNEEHSPESKSNETLSSSSSNSSNFKVFNYLN